MSQRRASDTIFSDKNPASVDTLTHQGRRYRKSSTTSAISGVSRPFTQSSTSIHSNNLSTSPITRPPYPAKHSTTAQNNSPKGGSLTRSIVLPPPQPPSVNAKGRPFSAKRSIKSRPTTLQPVGDEYRLQFALQHSKPLPPIVTSSSPSNTNNGQPSISSQASVLEAVDSAVDLEYHSQCGTPIDLPPHSDCSFNTYSPTTHRQKIGEMIEKGPSPQPNTESSLSINRDSTSSFKSNNDKRRVSLCLKLPNGERLQTNMPVDSSLKQIAEHAGKCTEIDLMNCDISTNEIPRQTFVDHSITLQEARIVVPTVLHFSFP